MSIILAWSVLSDVTRERFEEFRVEIIELITCDFLTQSDCPGLTAQHPDVSVYDRSGGSDTGFNMPPALIRLAFHDCGGIDPNKVKSGNNKFFTDPHKNGKYGGCNGCIGINNDENNNLLDAAIDPLEPICNDYSIDFSRADCWALAATIAIEWSASNLAPSRSPPFFQIIDAAVIEGDIPYYYGRNDCFNGYGENADIDFPFSNPEGVFFDFPDATLGWKHMDEFFKSRFGWKTVADCNNKGDYFTNRDIVALVSMAHSIGRAHERISGFSGAWDFSPDVVDNLFVAALFGEDYFQNLPVFNIDQNWNQSIRNPTEPGSKPQFQIFQPQNVIDQFNLDSFDPPILALLLAFNTDFSMIYDISWYIENGRKLDIDCNSNAKLVCGENQVILTAPRGKTSHFNNNGNEELGEQYECGPGEDCCPFRQCPIQCEGGWQEYRRLVDNDLIDTVDDNSNCPAAIAQKYSMKLKQDTRVENRALGIDFAKAFTKMITIGYVDKHSGEVLLKTVPCNDRGRKGKRGYSGNTDTSGSMLTDINFVHNDDDSTKNSEYLDRSWFIVTAMLCINIILFWYHWYREIALNAKASSMEHKSVKIDVTESS